MFYYMVNVSGKHGYSFMVSSEFDDLTDKQVLSAAEEYGLFDDAEDVLGATVFQTDDEYDISHFEDIGITNID